MSGRLFDKGRDGFLNALLSWTTHSQKAMLVDLTINGTSTRQVNGATNANPVVYQTTAAHGATVGDVVVVGGIGGNLSANQTGVIATVPDGTHYTLNTLEGIAVQGSGAFTTNGYMVNLTAAQFVADVNAGREGIDVVIPATASSRGIATSGNWTWLGVAIGNLVQAVIIYDASFGADGTNRVECFLDGKIRVVVNTAALAAATALFVEPLRGPLPTATVLNLSDGTTAVTSAPAALGARSISVTALAAGVALGATADAITTNAGLPVTPNGGNITFTVSSLYSPGGTGFPGFTSTGVFEL